MPQSWAISVAPAVVRPWKFWSGIYPPIRRSCYESTACAQVNPIKVEGIEVRDCFAELINALLLLGVKTNDAYEMANRVDRAFLNHQSSEGIQAIAIEAVAEHAAAVEAESNRGYPSQA
jgi:hypothetical protein